MGNRAIITAPQCDTGVYIHQNGSLQCVLAFLDVAQHRGYRDPSTDPEYALARLCGMLCEYFGMRESTCVGIGSLSVLDCDNYDNGVYVVGRRWQLVRRWGKGSQQLFDTAHMSREQLDQYQAVKDKLI